MSRRTEHTRCCGQHGVLWADNQRNGRLVPGRRPPGAGPRSERYVIAIRGRCMRRGVGRPITVRGIPIATLSRRRVGHLSAVFFYNGRRRRSWVRRSVGTRPGLRWFGAPTGAILGLGDPGARSADSGMSPSSRRHFDVSSFDVLIF